MQYQRTSPYPQLVNFDAPDTNVSAPRRRRSNSPLQALNLLNDPVFFEAAQALAIRAVSEAPPTWDDRLEYAFQLSLSRKPEAREKQRIAAFFDQQKNVFEKDPNSARLIAPNTIVGVDPAELAALTTLGRALMNLDEFITRE